MASFFGEVIEPSSRAFWNEDDELDRNDETEFVINWSEAEPASFEKFVVVETEMVNDFVEKCLINDANVVCTINNSNSQNCAKICSVGSVHICVVNSRLSLGEAGQITKLIIPLLTKSRYIHAITSDHLSHFKSEEVHLQSFLKTLCSSKARNNQNSDIGILSQPNIVTGVCAGVLSYAEISDLHCIIYILYTDTFTLDSLNALPLTELFSKLFEKKVPNFKSINFKAHNKGDLYM